MSFTLLDWSAIVGYLGITLILGLWFRGRSGKSVDDYFVSGRNVNWWLAGTSMVATTFAADTPLVVTGLVYSQGISGNWLWWGFLFSGMMTVFLFARLWRRSGLLTDVQFAEIRYSGKPAAFLRGFRAIYLGLLMNCVILGWVTKAMTSIVSTTLANTPMLNNVSAFMSRFGSVWSGNDGAALAICVLFLIPFTGLYVALGGLWGVLWTDLFQFVLKMSIVIAVAYYAIAACGGMSAVIASLQQMQAHAGGNAESPLNFLPNFSRGVTSEPMWMVPLANFFVFIGLQWWAFWYPGAEPGGGGYIAQRIFSARDEKQGLLSVLWFNIAHYAIRPWPWILKPDT
jgi:solute:Na+ symporter, SSS family